MGRSGNMEYSSTPCLHQSKMLPIHSIRFLKKITTLNSIYSSLILWSHFNLDAQRNCAYEVPTMSGYFLWEDVWFFIQMQVLKKQITTNKD